MKNVILVDRDVKFVQKMLDKDYKIIVLVVDSDKQKEELKTRYQDNPNIKYIYSMQDIDHVSGVKYLDYDFIESCRILQREQEFAAHRWLDNGMLASNVYYNTLGFWRNIFDTFDINLVLIDAIKRGCSYDIPAFLAKEKNIPSFFIPPVYGMNYVGILDFNKNKYILPISSNKTEPLKNYLFYEFNPQNLNLKVNKTNKMANLKRNIHSIIHSFGGQICVDFIMCLKNRNFIMKQHQGYYLFSFFDKFNSFLYVKKLKRYYDSIAKTPNLESNFIFYAMHFEPEGGTNVTVPLQNQLTIIQMLSLAIPKGWKLYVKEHPHQFNLNNAHQSFYYYNIKWWKNIEFYKELQKLDNVEILNYNIPSKTLIQKAKAISTINGTITLESVLYNKPVIVFGADYFPIQTKNMISIKGYKDLKIVMNNLQENIKIYDIGGVPEEILESMKDYALSYKTPMYEYIVLQTIGEYIENR
ncbi:Capsule polysaccharide biosynthesis protein [Campylobacter hyointestinalis subsp. hyointestinalis]|uniref:Capsule polysaccharide biosynthesis protein n=1 Tax=Campylobacter hyointestinalis subsp. hyointestinalis TaxID=91352 RepID=A0A0S4S1Y2_CAMHY|nr:hypothetical protein [Campylobacter hyointestinalis]PPB53526.1 hypothetical protein CDQ68_02395 [Campylobacter hyointestinalis subsp. hyointestinalis]PPB66245.1 hypothetical protein CDQ75_05475 [Campylobacter hyointestinalis subsp. hyointestinalis]PPB70963.1 hypothetical protein CDQ77_02415 [Campylobacter hyointestinalis subsp. hyointestinalis]CUU79961.1 Capsule polysaccharide biosynthesis protein [Campylobacter hyointestinalis subsp. hyointestinalis]